MSLSKLLRDFDNAIELAREEYDCHPARFSTSGFSDVFAGFSFYDKCAAEDIPPAQGSKLFARLDDVKSEPILWKHLHKSVSHLLRSDPDTKKYYGGFTTLFTLNRDVSSGEPRYPSMTIDCKLQKAGFHDLILSKKQFEKCPTNPVARPIPLTAVCLKTVGDTDFGTTPIIFHWTRPGYADPDPSPSTMEELHSWGHVYVTADIHYNSENGIEIDWSKTDFRAEDSKLVRVGDNPIANGTKRFNEREFYRRLQRYVGEETTPDAVLARRIAWTVTYFAYACELYLEKRLDYLAIVCAPASYDEDVSSALYVPLVCHSSSGDFAVAAITILYLARALASQLWTIQAISSARKEAQAETIEDMSIGMSHELSKQTTVLFSNRLRRFSDLFSINDLERTNTKTDCFDWPDPVGSISVSGEIASRVADWYLCPMPELLNVINQYLTIWGASPGSLASLGVNSDALKDFLERAVDVAVGGVVAETMKGSRPRDLKMCQNVVKETNTKKDQLRNRVKINYGKAPVCLPSPHTVSDTEQLLLSRLFRAIAAAVSNALKNSETDKQIDLTAELITNGPEAKEIQITISNLRRDKNRNQCYDDGTIAVLRGCLRGIMVDTKRIKCNSDPEHQDNWITQFSCVCNGTYREQQFQIFHTQN